MTLRKTTRTTKTPSTKSKTPKRHTKNSSTDPKSVIDAFVQTLKNLESHLKK